MKLEEVAREAGAAARGGTLRSVDVEAGLARLQVTKRRRDRARMLAIAASSAAVLLVILGVSVTSTSSPSGGPPAGQPPASTGEECAGNKAVSCSANGFVYVEGQTPYRFHLTDTFMSHLGQGFTPGSVEAYQDRPGARAAVTVLEHAVADDPGATAMSAEHLASWVANRPWLEHSVVLRTAVGGRTAWRVDVRVRPETRWPQGDSCNRSQPDCRPLLKQTAGKGQWETGPWRGMVSRYLFVDTPHGEPLVIWSWAFDYDVHALNVNERLISSFRFR